MMPESQEESSSYTFLEIICDFNRVDQYSTIHLKPQALYIKIKRTK